MKTKLAWIFAVRRSCFAAVAMTLALSTVKGYANLLTNPGFESGNGSQVSDWTSFGNAWQSTNHARSGTCSLKLYGTWIGTWNASGVYQTLPARPGQRWTLSGYGLNASDDPLAGQNYALKKIVWFNGPNGTGQALQPLPGPGAFGGANPGIESAQLTNGTPTNVWQFLSASGVAPPGTMSVQLLGGLFLQPNYETGAAWFDDLKASATPVWGHALSFDGVNDYVEFPRLVSGDFTLECWFRSTQMAGEEWQWYFGMGLVDGEVAGVTNDFGLALGAGKVLFGTGGTSDTTIHSGVVADGQWHHVAATREQASGAMKLYVDGQLVASGTGGTAPLTAPLNMRVGSLATGTNFFQGELDDVRIWNVARTANEISQSMVYPLAGTETGLAAYAKCDEGSGDAVLDTVSGTYVPLVGPQWTPSTIPLWGNALSFDGTDDRVQATSFASFPSNAVTVEFWMQSADTSRDGTPFSYATSASDNTFLVFNYRNFQIYAGGSATVATGVSANDGQWHHIAATWSSDSGACSLYRDGALVYLTNLAVGTSLPSGGTLVLGQEQDSQGGGFDTSQAFQGRMDDVRIWSTARTQAEIAADMLHPLTGMEPNLVAYWSFDEASGSLVQDGTLNNHNGILTNGTTRISSIISAPNLAVNPGFEQGTGGWWPFGPTTLKNSSSWPHSGASSVLVSNRTDTWQGLQQQFEHILQPSLDYLISAWVRPDSAASQPVYLNILKTDSSGTSYPLVAAGMATSNAWTRLSGSYTPELFGILTNLWLYMAGPAAGVKFYADDFVMAPDMAYAPVVLAATTLPTSGMMNSNATLNGSVQPGGLPTTARLEWRTNLVYEHATAPIAVGTVWEELSVSNALSGLTPGLIYHCRLVASNRLGAVRGADQMFWLPALRLNSPDPLTNECHAAFVDPITANGLGPAIVAGGAHGLVLRADGSVIGWGLNSSGQTNIPADLTEVVAIAAGGWHSLALTADGSVVGWGHNFYGETSVPDSATNNVTAIAAGGLSIVGPSGHSLALRGDGSVVGWGVNGDGQTTIPAGATNGVVAIAAGGFHNLALKADGSIIGWGDNSAGQTNVPAGASNGVVAIAAGGYHSLALKADGSVVAWGDNYYGQTNIPAGASNGVVAIAAGGFHSLALKADGSVVGWGAGGPGTSGAPHYGQSTIPAGASNGVVAIAAGDFHSLALKADGSVVGWGRNNFGQTNIPAGLNTLNLPIAVSGTVDTNTPGIYHLNYSVTNALGAAATATRTVVVADTLPPTLTLLGENPLMQELGAPFTDPGATASDLCAGDRTGNILFTNTVSANLAGAYTNTFTVTDASGNVAVTNRLVLVVSRPVLTGLEHLSDGAFQFAFTSTPGARFNVVTTTNLALPASQWTVLGPATEGPPGQFQFTDMNATNRPQRFYRLAWP